MLVANNPICVYSNRAPLPGLYTHVFNTILHMKKTWQYFIPTFFLSGAAAYLLLAGIFGDGWRKEPEILFTIVTLLHLAYYVWLARTKRISKKLILGYIPISLAFFICIIYVVVKPPIIRTEKISLGPDPYYPSSTMSLEETFWIWQPGFWSTSARASRKAYRIQKIRTARQGSMFDHTGTELAGWSEYTIVQAYGEPSSIEVISSSTQKWIYHPWKKEGQRDWAMPVYVTNGVLERIGD